MGPLSSPSHPQTVNMLKGDAALPWVPKGRLQKCKPLKFFLSKRPQAP
jgi:hypothetical protein